MSAALQVCQWIRPPAFQGQDREGGSNVRAGILGANDGQGLWGLHLHSLEAEAAGTLLTLWLDWGISLPCSLRLCCSRSGPWQAHACQQSMSPDYHILEYIHSHHDPPPPLPLSLLPLWRHGGMQDGKTDYKSVTVASNATAEEFIDFYFDDNVRMKWVWFAWPGLLYLPRIPEYSR